MTTPSRPVSPASAGLEVARKLGRFEGTADVIIIGLSVIIDHPEIHPLETFTCERLLEMRTKLVEALTYSST